MKILYLECSMGASGDMLLGALLELHPNPEEFLKTMNALGIPGVSVTAKRTDSRGIAGTHVDVLVNGQEESTRDVHSHASDSPHAHSHDTEHAHSSPHSHASLHEITRIISALELPEPVRANALAVYHAIGEAEAQAHGVPVSEIHFHEVGTMDAVTDIVGVCLLIEELHVDQICASPIAVGFGTVECAHGVLPVPAPATAYLLDGIPSYGGETEGELCTPTGAAILKHFVGKFGPQPSMTAEKLGCGIGAKSFPRANILRAALGTAADFSDREEIYELSCSIDDMSAEDMAYGAEVLRNAGALEVYTLPAYMKKGRPGIVLTCLCRDAERETLLGLIFRHFSTLGIRETAADRYVLRREIRTEETVFGPVRYKTASGWNIVKQKPELEDLKAIAEKTGLSLREIREQLAK